MQHFLTALIGIKPNQPMASHQMSLQSMKEIKLPIQWIFKTHQLRGAIQEEPEVKSIKS